MTQTANIADIDLLIVDDDHELRADLATFFSRSGYRVQQSEDGDQALALIDRQTFDVMILDMVMPGLPGLELLERLKQHGAECEVVVLTGAATVEAAVEAMKLGAREFLAKPIRFKELDRLVRKAHEAGALRKENHQLKAVLHRQQTHPKIIGQSLAMREVYRLIDRIGPTDEPVLIQGESGTGKELVAHALHQASQLADKPLVVVNCAALSETLLESELFGHEKGAFTGAVTTKPGLFEVADGGTLFIDEIGELAGPLQAKLLRILEDGTMRRVGSVKQRRVHVRLVAATNRDIAQEVEAGRFREDLFYRINVLTIDLPPLRQRGGDIDLLIRHFCGADWHVAETVIPALESYNWPGNVRQLQNAIQRAKVLAEDHAIRLENLPAEIVAGAQARDGSRVETETNLDSLNKRHIAEVLRRYRGNKARTAQALGIGRRTLYRLLDKFQINNNC